MTSVVLEAPLPFSGENNPYCATSDELRHFAYRLVGDTRGTLWEKGENMLWTIALILVVLWLLGLATSYTIGGLIHILLVIAVVMILVNLISRRGRI
jgi:hypothetical protein